MKKFVQKHTIRVAVNKISFCTYTIYIHCRQVGNVFVLALHESGTR
jgi:hypothetical protein